MSNVVDSVTETWPSRIPEKTALNPGSGTPPPRFGAKAAKWLLPFCLLFLAGCTVCPPSKDNWSANIEARPDAQPPAPDTRGDDEPETAGSWYWQDGSGTWRYSLREQPKAPAEQWIYEARSVVLQVTTPEQLNLYMGQSHTLTLKVIQLSNPGIISELRQSPFGLSDLMAAKGNALSATIVREDRLVIEPGVSKTLVLDREQGVRYIALVAGYFEMESKKSVRIIPIPSVEARILPCYDTRPWVFGDPPPPKPDDMPARLKLWLDLAPGQIDTLQVQAY